jgi:hypothetical protein
MRMTISRGQKEIQKLQQEVVTGRYADIGLALGAKTSNSVIAQPRRDAAGNHPGFQRRW